LSLGTESPEIFPYKVGDREILLVDMPGFNDTNLSDTEILTLIADWMCESYQGGILLSGIIYLHQISDNGMDRESEKSLRLVRKICGEDNLGNVILATTMWEHVDEASATLRERELVEIYWKEMIARGSRIDRISTNVDEARRLVETFLTKKTFVAQLQHELSIGKTLIQTEAGVALKDEFENVSREFEKELASVKEELEKARTKRKWAMRKHPLILTRRRNS
jgi:hypothetical protein